MNWLKQEKEELKKLSINIHINPASAKYLTYKIYKTDVYSFNMWRGGKTWYIIELYNTRYHGHEAYVRIYKTTFNEIYDIAKQYIKENNLT